MSKPKRHAGPELIEVGRVWKTRDRRGNPSLTGYTRADRTQSVPPRKRLLVLPNRERKTDADPDFIVYFALHGPFYDPARDREMERLVDA
jgi:hypothetical protein